MRLSRYFLPVLKETPSEAQIVSHRLMLRAGMIKRLTSGVYTWMPLGLRVLRKVEMIIREEMNRAGAFEVLMPTMQPAELWIVLQSRPKIWTNNFTIKQSKMVLMILNMSKLLVLSQDLRVLIFLLEG